MGIAPYERVQRDRVGADAHIGPHGKRKASLYQSALGRSHLVIKLPRPHIYLSEVMER